MLEQDHIERIGVHHMSIRLGERAALFAISALLMLVPFLVVDFPPITDLPQHLAQIRLLGDALADPGGPYQIQWWTPYTVAYAPLALFQAVAPPLLAGRLAVAFIGLLWVVTAHAVAARRGRSPLAAVLASLFVFCNVIYWGFLPFAIGWPVFVLWMLLADREMRRPRDVLLLAVVGLVLYACHALWLLAGLAWMGLASAADIARVVWTRSALRPLTSQLIWRACAAAPALIALAAWTPGFQASDQRRPAVWNTDPLMRLDPDWLIDAMLGGLRGPIEWILAGAVFAWVVTGVVQHRHRLRETVDGTFLLGAVLLGGLAMVLPDRYMHTIQLPERWLPFAAMLLVLAVPAPRLRPALLRLAVVGLAAVFVAVTTSAWVAFERRELTGLAEALERLPSQPRVLGLDFQKRSALVRGRPFLQTYAWAQVLKGGTLNFSFASYSTSLVVFRAHRPQPWTPKLYWFPEHLRARDLAYFDYAIVNASPEVHEEFMKARRFVPVTKAGSWRLYRVRHRPPSAAKT